MKTVTNETALFGTEPLFKRFTNENGAKTKRPYWGPSPFDAFFLPIKTGKRETALFGAEPLFNLLTNENGDK